MLERLGNPKGILGTSISANERKMREPPLLVLLKYAQLAGISLEVTVDDDIELSIKLPAKARNKKHKQEE